MNSKKHRLMHGVQKPKGLVQELKGLVQTNLLAFLNLVSGWVGVWMGVCVWVRGRTPGNTKLQTIDYI